MPFLHGGNVPLLGRRAGALAAGGGAAASVLTGQTVAGTVARTTSYALASSFTVTEEVQVTRLGVYVGSQTTVGCRLVVANGGRTEILASTDYFGPFGSQPGWLEAFLLAPFSASAGQQVWVGVEQNGTSGGIAPRATSSPDYVNATAAPVTFPTAAFWTTASILQATPNAQWGEIMGVLFNP